MGLTPMMRQYLDIKEQYGDAILFFRLGDFYEMFMEDAKKASSILEIALTGRDAGLEEKIPMCGIPYHAANTYIRKLLDKGLKVAICEQVEDPKLTKGIVKREVTRIITPGTIMEELSLNEKNNNYIGAIIVDEDFYALAYADITTGEFMSTSIPKYEGLDSLYNEAERLDIKELVSKDLQMIELAKDRGIYATLHDGEEVGVEIGIDFNNDVIGYNACSQSINLLYSYLKYTQKGNIKILEKAGYYSLTQYMAIDSWSRQNLELSRNIRTGDNRNTLLSILDKTKTAFGGRLLKRWLEQPLLDLEQIIARQNIVELQFQDVYFNQAIREALKGVYDIERILGRLSFGTGNGKDLLALKNSLINIEKIRVLLIGKKVECLANYISKLEDSSEVIGYLEVSISDEPPFTLKEGGIIKAGYNEDIDYLRKMSNESKDLIKELEAKERERLGIKSLKVGYNKVFGYYLEITKSNAHLAPADYIRKQTIASGERFINEELKNLEYALIHSKDKLIALEYEIFSEIRNKILMETDMLKRIAACVGEIDVLSSFAYVAQINDYIRPSINNEQDFKLESGRHPMVEKLVDFESYVVNDFDIKDNNLAIITGPNMAGKSTFIRMLAILTIMAQCGSYIPAKSFEFGIVDKVYARVGASDDLGSGQSTFMVEMNEVASILQNATNRSLIILDEVGRGTSTLDGLSIAWAVSEYLLTKIKARTVFATHYHELIDLDNYFKNVFNLSMAVQEYKDQIVFLRKVVPGGADKSYGIHVAKMAGLPDDLIRRAEEKMNQFEFPDTPEEKQLSLEIVEQTNPLKELLAEVNPNELTPLEALELVYKLKVKIQEK
ncbi:MAG: DNA mismatch repair protein MutS [Fusobacteria bacterium]|nr:MAG: DNA mismatch repair protein MutS [Fusobacteriota bacterium]KAF0230068.1 MAG: DNA mismatch repair protein [Fusobacteriota bacterium]